MYPFTPLEGNRVKLVPLEVEHIPMLYSSAQSPEIWSNYPITVQTLDDMSRFVHRAIEARSRNEQFPYAVYDNELQQFVGSTRYLRISSENRNLNIGSTWYNPLVWRTRVNTETKSLMLHYAFETLQVCRVEIITTTDNFRSQRAIERLGAIREGILRKKYHGLDYVVYSIIDREWPEVRARLEGYLDRGGQ
jgi:N-acetyltransferase